jgi:hypothetical protein
MFFFYDILPRKNSGISKFNSLSKHYFNVWEKYRAFNWYKRWHIYLPPDLKSWAYKKRNFDSHHIMCNIKPTSLDLMSLEYSTDNSFLSA